MHQPGRVRECAYAGAYGGSHDFWAHACLLPCVRVCVLSCIRACNSEKGTCGGTWKVMVRDPQTLATSVISGSVGYQKRTWRPRAGPA